ncbi:MAG: class I SAM-dependent methyltransferase [Cyanobacteria bacterium]|nr:class I SAM-dependent methyltransferase [Cyanobacteriota bacterium]
MLTLTKPGIEEYALSKTDKHSDLLEELMKETYETMDMPQMLTGPIEGNLLKMIARLVGVKTIVEIGTFTGYATLQMADALPEDGKLYTLDLNPVCLAVARRYFARSPHAKKIQVLEGPALESLNSLEGPFDLVFIDADKGNYLNYYEAVLPKVRTGGVVLIDNVLWSGKVLEPSSADDHAIVSLNERVAADDRVDKVLLTVRDGVFFVRKR